MAGHDDGGAQPRIASSSTCTKRWSSAQRSISWAASSALWPGTTMEARSRGSVSSHSAASHLLMARQNASERSSLNSACAPCSTLQMAKREPNPSSAWARSSAGSLPGRPLAGRQSGRPESGAFGGHAPRS